MKVMNESAFDKFENLYKEPKIAEIHTRVFAFILDFLFFFMIGKAIGLLSGTDHSTVILSLNLSGVFILLFLGIGVFLWPVSEGLYGQTIGKRLLDIKVIANKDKSMHIGRAFVRFLLGFVDLIFLLGIVVAIFDKRNNRLGDILADTSVIQSKYNG
ncbi:RDD family protein [Tenacibaculum jejuense]|uniref:Putative RDD domain-containing protein n=1 Tax=Tenacibaculum jejuense TaxID=584609 RepID=A0A238U9L6_9FLAO|nr:RDD family protein [Tenacibaculum jejuense]SNR15110.1 putative RDD domain-containing protein [Tenacibaculum jejuense]